MKFKISSGLKNNIGKELITDDNVAILELVKNSYDAGAKTVKIIFQDMNHKYDSKIYVVDDGKGMTKNDIETKWLFVGYSEKKDSKISKDKRMMAGQKGIGRFSCDRLGRKLKITTKAPTDKEFNILKLNWKHFERDQKKEFQSIQVEVTTQEIVDKKLNFIDKSGTLVEISEIEKEWDRDKLLKLKRYLQRLINPLQIESKDKFKIILEAKEFLPKDNKEKDDYNKVNGEVINKVYEKIGMKTTTIDCEILSNGKTITTKLNDKGIDIFNLEEENNEFKLLQNIKIKISYLNRNARTIFSRIMGVQSTEYGNILLFKNGFRIFPYGERHNDWLRLNDRKTQGYKRYLGTRELFGRVEINGDQSEFREVTSRSGGLVNTDSVEELFKFIMKFVLPRLEKYVIGAIDWDSERSEHSKDFENIKKDTLKVIESIAGNLENKKLTYNEDFLQIIEEKTIEKVPEVIKNIENISKKEKDQEIKEMYFQQIQSLKQGLRLQKEEQKEEIRETKSKLLLEKKEREKKEKQALFLQSVLSKDTKEIIGLQHQIKMSTNNIKNYLTHLKLTPQEEMNFKEYQDILDLVLIENEKIHSIVEFVTQANYDLKASEIKEDIIQFIKQYLLEVHPTIAKKYGEKILKIKFKNDPKFIKEFKPLEITIILDNIISNSQKALANILEISFTINKNTKKLEISFKDDGRGISEDDIDNIFDFGYTTTDGSGVGLHHIKEILKGIKGEIKINNKLPKGTEVIIQIPK